MYVYMVECADGSYYTGVTNNLDRRMYEHSHGLDFESYTYSRRPLRLVYYTEFTDFYKAFDLEKRIKGWSRSKKSALIRDDWDILHKLSSCKNSTNYLKNCKNSHPERSRRVRKQKII